MEKQHSRSSPAPKPQTPNDVKSSLNGYTLRGRSPSGKLSRRPCRNYLTGNCTNLSCIFFGIFSNVNVTKHIRDADSVKKCVFRHKEVGSQPDEKPKNSGGKGFVALFQNSKQLGCVFQDVERKSKSILTGGPKILETEAQHAILKCYITSRQNSGKKGSITRCHSAF